MASVVKEKQDGDPRFLQIVGNCVAKRCEIMGLVRPVVAHEVKIHAVERLSDADLEKVILEGVRLLTRGEDDDGSPGTYGPN